MEVGLRLLLVVSGRVLY
jgi:hypothetical protein